MYAVQRGTGQPPFSYRLRQRTSLVRMIKSRMNAYAINVRFRASPHSSRCDGMRRSAAHSRRSTLRMIELSSASKSVLLSSKNQFTNAFPVVRFWSRIAIVIS
jgi:hypothetical protein